MRRDRTGDVLDEQDDTHTCDNGWLGEDTHGRPRPCLTCRPHLPGGRPQPPPQPRRYQQAERRWQKQVVAYAQQRGWRVDHHRGSAGWPDLALVRDGRLVVAELKADAGRVSPQQREWLTALRAVPGVEVHLWKPSDWPAIQRVLT